MLQYQTSFRGIMGVSYINSTVLLPSPTASNGTADGVTVYQSCKDFNAVLIWYLIMQFLNMFLGIPANLTVLWLIRRNKDSSTSDVFIFHLALLDTLFCLIFPLELLNIVCITSDTSWYVLRFFYGIKDTSPLLLSCICLDRYVAVLHPITFTKLKDCQHRTILVAGVWLVILIYSAAKCAVGDIFNFDKVFTGIILAVFFFMVFCNTAILIALRQSLRGRDVMHPVKRRAFKLVLIILAIIVFNYLPPVALFPFQSFFSPDVFRCYIHYIAFGLMDLSSSIQPVLYLSKDKLQWGLKCCRRTASDIPNSTRIPRTADMSKTTDMPSAADCQKTTKIPGANDNKLNLSKPQCLEETSQVTNTTKA